MCEALNLWTHPNITLLFEAPCILVHKNSILASVPWPVPAYQSPATTQEETILWGTILYYFTVMFHNIEFFWFCEATHLVFPLLPK